ncbi:MAG: hypothetical protein LBL21_04030 [Rickettsiales bacterium]|jgi:hypothetical protein|nr:hypothetical protein [Rickettsiales bacterium]
MKTDNQNPLGDKIALWTTLIFLVGGAGGALTGAALAASSRPISSKLILAGFILLTIAVYHMRLTIKGNSPIQKLAGRFSR